VPQEQLPNSQLINHAYFPGLTAKPWWDAGDFSFVGEIEEKYKLLAEENKLRNRWENAIPGNQGWFAERLVSSGSLTPSWKAGHNSALASILSKTGLHKSPRTIMLSRQVPGAGISEHTDLLNFVLTMHIGLDIPGGNETWMEVAGIRRLWKTGRCSVFDSSFPHWTWNGGNAPRDVVVVDMWHPELTQEEIDGISWLYRFRHAFLERAHAPWWHTARRKRLPEPRPRLAGDQLMILQIDWPKERWE
jgi:aspartate beta-hydroxylase